MHSLPEAHRQVDFPKGSFLPRVLSKQSPTVSKDSGKASPLTGITMLQTRHKTPLIFNALLSGLKGTGTWRNCAAKCVFLCKAHWTWLHRKKIRTRLGVYLCICVCACLADRSKKTILICLIRKPHHLKCFLACGINISTEPCQLLQTHGGASVPQNSQWQVPH